MNVRYHELARQEIIETTRYYAQLRDGLGAEFRKELDRVVTLIVDRPESFEKLKSGMRRCKLRRFPYAVYYRIVGDQSVRIVIVKHHGRRPGFGMRRR